MSVGVWFVVIYCFCGFGCCVLVWICLCLISGFVVFRCFWCCLVVVGLVVVVAVLLFPSCCCYGAWLLDCF